MTRGNDNAGTMDVVFSQRDLHRDARVRRGHGRAKQHERDNNNLFHICLSLLCDVVFTAHQMDEARAIKFNRLLAIL